ncbi:hypothetical protein TSUD_373740 [Trifolium subterraneum]|uniref:Stress-response A/B barrel domain-containing protein n=1 Tax=Trifolium subterraneum TaxID=3900 RepID=A0A2Z6N8K8_TRISU|nr:hypothetical protein TSUD_373740 [Trifolium subterraneum]
MSSTSTSQGVEHIVLLKVKDNIESSKINTMINEVQSLVTIEQVRHFIVGPLLTNNKTTSTTIPFSDLSYTHLVHSRYESKEDLQIYNDHPNHINVVRGFVFPICDDLLVIDWIGEDVALLSHPLPGIAFRLSLLKLKDEKDTKVKEEVFRALRGIEENVGGVSYVSYGENISPERAKGFSIASLVIFSRREGLDRVEPEEGLVKVKGYLESVVVVDFVVPSK